MPTLAEDIEAFVLLHRRFKSNELTPSERARHDELRARVEAALRQPDAPQGASAQGGPPEEPESAA